jgi:hypothetical protein
MRKKLRLDPELLRVESFATDRLDDLRGTVRAAQTDAGTQACYSCGGTCGATPALPRREGATAVDDATAMCATRDYCCV